MSHACLSPFVFLAGLFPSGGSNVSFQGSPESSAGARGGFISVQLYKNVSANHDSSSASPKYVAPRL